jgi:hypothetical protein
MKWPLVVFGVLCYLLSDRLPLMQHDSEAVKASRAVVVEKPTEPVVLRPAHGYSDKDVKEHTRLVTKSIREVEKREKAQQIAKLWNITPENINSYREWW